MNSLLNLTCWGRNSFWMFGPTGFSVAQNTSFEHIRKGNKLTNKQTHINSLLILQPHPTLRLNEIVYCILWNSRPCNSGEDFKNRKERLHLAWLWCSLQVVVRGALEEPSVALSPSLPEKPSFCCSAFSLAPDGGAAQVGWVGWRPFQWSFASAASLAHHAGHFACDGRDESRSPPAAFLGLQESDFTARRKLSDGCMEPIFEAEPKKRGKERKTVMPEHLLLCHCFQAAVACFYSSSKFLCFLE